MGQLYSQDEYYRISISGTTVSVPAASSAYITYFLTPILWGIDNDGDRLTFNNTATYLISFTFSANTTPQNANTTVEIYNSSDVLVFSRTDTGTSLTRFYERIDITAGSYLKVKVGHTTTSARTFFASSTSSIERDFTNNTEVAFPKDYENPAAEVRITDINDHIDVLPFYDFSPFSSSAYYPRVTRIDDTRAFVSSGNYGLKNGIYQYFVSCFIIERMPDGTLESGPVHFISHSSTQWRHLESERHGVEVFVEDGLIVIGSFQFYRATGTPYNEMWRTFLLSFDGRDIEQVDYWTYDPAYNGFNDNFPDIVRLSNNSVVVFHYGATEFEVLQFNNSGFISGTIHSKIGSTNYQATRAVNVGNNRILLSTFVSAGVSAVKARVLLVGEWDGSAFDWSGPIDFPDVFVDASIFSGTEVHLASLGDGKVFALYGADTLSTSGVQQRMGPQYQPGGSVYETGQTTTTTNFSPCYTTTKTHSSVWSQLRVMYMEIDDNLKISFSSPLGLDSMVQFGAFTTSIDVNPHEANHALVTYMTPGTGDWLQRAAVIKLNESKPTNIEVLEENAQFLPFYSDGSYGNPMSTYLGWGEVITVGVYGSALTPIPENWPQDCNVGWEPNYNSLTGTFDPPLDSNHEGIIAIVYNVPYTSPPPVFDSFVKRFFNKTGELSLFAGDLTIEGISDGPVLTTAKFKDLNDLAALSGGPQRNPIIPETNRFYIADDKTLRVIHPCDESILVGSSEWMLFNGTFEYHYEGDPNTYPDEINGTGSIRKVLPKTAGIKDLNGQMVWEISTDQTEDWEDITFVSRDTFSFAQGELVQIQANFLSPDTSTGMYLQLNHWEREFTSNAVLISYEDDPVYVDGPFVNISGDEYGDWIFKSGIGRVPRNSPLRLHVGTYTSPDSTQKVYMGDNFYVGTGGITLFYESDFSSGFSNWSTTSPAYLAQAGSVLTLETFQGRDCIKLSRPGQTWARAMLELDIPLESSFLIEFDVWIDDPADYPEAMSLSRPGLGLGWASPFHDSNEPGGYWYTRVLDWHIPPDPGLTTFNWQPQWNASMAGQAWMSNFRLYVAEKMLPGMIDD